MRKILRGAFIHLLLVMVFVTNNIAFALDPVQAGMADPVVKLQLEKMSRDIERKYNNMSDEKKLKYLKRTERRLARGRDKVSGMSEKKFKKMLTKASERVDSEELSDEEKHLYSGLSEASLKMGKVKIDNSNISQLTLVEKIESTIVDVQAEIRILEKKISGVKTDEDLRKPACEGGVIVGIIIMAGAMALFILAILSVVGGGFVILSILLMLPGAGLSASCG